MTPQSFIFACITTVGVFSCVASTSVDSRPPLGGLIAQLTLAKTDYRNGEAVVATLRLLNPTARAVRFRENPQPTFDEYLDDKTSIPSPGQALNNAYSGLAQPWPERTLGAGKAIEESFPLTSPDVIEDPVRANAFASVEVRFGRAQPQILDTNVVTWTTILNSLATFKFGDLGDDRPLYVTHSEVDEPMVFPVQAGTQGRSAVTEAQRSSEALALFDDASPVHTFSLESELAYEIGAPYSTSVYSGAPPVPIPRLPFLPLQTGTATGLAPNPYVRKFQDDQRLPPFPFEVAIRRVVASSGTGTPHLHRVLPIASYERSYDEAVDDGYLNRFVPPPIRFEIDSDRTMIETVAAAPRSFAQRLGLDAVDLSYIYATERARRIAALLHTALHACALVVPFGPAPRSQTIAVAMTVQRAATIADRTARAEPTPSPAPTPRFGNPPPYQKPEYAWIDVPQETTRVSADARKAVWAPADAAFVRIWYTAGTESRALSATTIATMEQLLNAMTAVARYRIDQPDTNRPAMLTMALGTADAQHIRLVAGALAAAISELPTTSYRITYFSTQCPRLDDEAIAAALAVARANAEQAAGGRRLRKLVLVSVGPAGFGGGTCGGPLPPADSNTGGALDPAEAPRITTEVPVHLVYRTYAHT